MPRVIFIIGVAIAIQNINCAPSYSEETNEPHETNEKKSELDEPKLNDKLYSVFGSDGVITDEEKTQGQRQKRWYENAPYNYYPLPLSRPYNADSEIVNSLYYIQMRLQEILNIAKSPPQPPPPSVYPVFVPIYIPQISCGCNPVNDEEPQPTKAPEQTTKINTNLQNVTIPTLHDRLPEMEDERQNWGLLINNTLADYDDDDDGTRPISLTPPISLTSNDNGIPAPPVEHGSSQSDTNAETQPTTTVSSPRVVPSLENSSKPSACDNAVLSCCLGFDATHKCIQSHGCRTQSISDDPCNPENMLSVIGRVESYYGKLKFL